MDTSQLQSQITALQSQVTALQKTFETHNHDGSRTVKLSQNNITPNIRAMGSITMSTLGQTYRLGTIANPTALTFFGTVTNGSGGHDFRAFTFGNAQLGKSYYFQPQSSNSVTEGGLPENIIQGCSSLVVDSTNTQAKVYAPIGQEHLIDVWTSDPNTILVRATVTEFAVDHVSIYIDNLASGWSITGNFVVT